VLIDLGTTDVPIDPKRQGKYRANREVLWDSVAFEKMRSDAKKGRPFSNIVVEYTTEFEPEYPIKIIGGQHRFQAIRNALENGVDVYHGVKIYLQLNPIQRLDAQLISNTNIAVSPDLLDRMQETQRGPELRDWCQKVGLLPAEKDFTDKYERGGNISVQMARTFIVNFFEGMDKANAKFDRIETTPYVCSRGIFDEKWANVLAREWQDEKLELAAREFVALVAAQRASFKGQKARRDRPEKALNIAVISAWAFVAGLLSGNQKRLRRHFALRTIANKDPLNSDALDRGRHKTDPDNYRGLGFRTDPKERGRFVELFYLQAEKGGGIKSAIINAAITSYHAKQANLEAISAKEKV
jgi:hypothetical protein